MRRTLKSGRIRCEVGFEGKVGVGTENPDAQVEIVGDSQGANDEGILRIESDAKKGDANLRFGVEKGSRQSLSFFLQCSKTDVSSAHL